MALEGQSLVFCRCILPFPELTGTDPKAFEFHDSTGHPEAEDSICCASPQWEEVKMSVYDHAYGHNFL